MPQLKLASRVAELAILRSSTEQLTRCEIHEQKAEDFSGTEHRSEQQRKHKERKVYISKHGLWDALDRPTP